MKLFRSAEKERTKEELERLDQPSYESCPLCGWTMSVGEAEAGGICSKCYWESVGDSP